MSDTTAHEELVSAVSKWVHHERAWRLAQNPMDARLMVKWRDETIALCGEYDRRPR
jgi:hypothetical protein